MPVINILVFVFVIITNYLAVKLPLNGKTTGELSDQYPNLFTPGGITFSIWGVIYFFLALFIVYQAVIVYKKYPATTLVKRITPYFIINGLANAAWLFAWHYEYVWLSVIIMLVMLATLIIIHQKLELAKSWRSSQKLFLDIPFSLYLGWISIATIANITVLLSTNGIAPLQLSETTWTIIMIVAATFLTLLVLWRRQNIVFALVVGWALWGIVLKQSMAGNNAIVTASYTSLAVIAAGILFTIFAQKQPALVKTH